MMAFVHNDERGVGRPVEPLRQCLDAGDLRQMVGSGRTVAGNDSVRDLEILERIRELADQFVTMHQHVDAITLRLRAGGDIAQRHSLAGTRRRNQRGRATPGAERLSDSIHGLLLISTKGNHREIKPAGAKIGLMPSVAPAGY